ncbi:MULTISPECIES: D-aminoacyl-tRNA deacylase [unclassified Lentimicrobium]|uniref:D-aminoacyl-tRNA deacylase n=1 Tax=unclassified Lentimicrobium TaxID=2677434 RepID=UPI0015573E4E|nr:MULTISPECIES: D-aminoacyl-tRNA deacylase [unclassified Lentimicrobium]NPD45098.1 D-tyrosyl-tRNA(Tyr) deacylase [Lentimicrobium sp. S6]NPD85385.1 D-tyrosyl-tRNA(Tyr) deacylase [Lentimicrobium sp. L6]
MRVLIQRVSEASVKIDGHIKSEIAQGLLILLGIENEDGQEDINWLVEKILKLRIFDDENGVMNLSLMDVNGDLMLISQFTLHASTRKGARPSYIKAARPEKAIPLYEAFIKAMEEKKGGKIATGEFGADMKVGLINDGPVTIWIDSKNKE